MAADPLAQLNLTCASTAEHLGFVALADVAKATVDSDSRIIGGQMITLHVLRWGLDLTRLTQDVDLGVPPMVVRTPELTDGLERLGYSKTAGNRFEKLVTELSATVSDPYAVVDVLVPAYSSRPRHNRRFGEHLVTTEVPGLAAAFRRQPVDLPLEITFLDGSRRRFPVRLPHEAAALTLKVMARTVRRKDSDAVDVWRALEVCAAAGMRDIDFGPDEDPVRQVLGSQFTRGGDAIAEIAQARNLSDLETTRLETRIQALGQQMLP